MKRNCTRHLAFTLIFLQSLAHLPAALAQEPSLDQPQQDTVFPAPSPMNVVPPSPPPPPDRDTATASASAQKTGHDAAEGWRWRKTSLGEIAGVSVVGALAGYAEAAFGEPKRPVWTARNGFDEGARDVFRLRGRAGEDVAADVGDALMGAMIAAPIIDSVAALGLRDRNWEALWETSWINMESFAFTALVSTVMQNSIRREKPYARNCPGGTCGIDEQPNRSMPSGHAAFAFTGAGLICTNYRYQSFYDPATERWACGGALAVASLDGIARLMADRHYLSDVLVGSALGLFSGFALPRLLHYSWRNTTSSSEREPANEPVQLTLVPQVLADGAALNCQVLF